MLLQADQPIGLQYSHQIKLLSYIIHINKCTLNDIILQRQCYCYNHVCGCTSYIYSVLCLMFTYVSACTFNVQIYRLVKLALRKHLGCCSFKKKIVILCHVCPMLPLSPHCPHLIAFPVFFKVYFLFKFSNRGIHVYVLVI